jgi:molybdate transport system substrate-binding protein
MNMGQNVLRALLCLVSMQVPAAARAGEAMPPLRVAAAADLKFALDEIVSRYGLVRPGVEVNLVFGSSGKFYTQLVNGAPFDLYLSADVEYTRRLIDDGIAVAGSEFPYAVGRIVLWVPKESPLAVEKDGMKVLLSGTVRRLAIANPQHAPYGKAAEAALRKYGLYDQVKGKLVLGENASQTAQFVQTRNVDAAILPLSLASAPVLAADGRYWLIPMDAHPKLEQAGVRIKASANPEEAKRFARFLSGPEGRSILKRYGFILPRE